MSFQDKSLTCKDCGKPFVWTKGEQEFFAQKGFDKPPIRCQDCRKKKKQGRDTRPQENVEKNELHDITCSKCGKTTEVNFRPRNPIDVLCSECFQKK
jgi:CxxC-x17-CxxC domain-containing protein